MANTSFVFLGWEKDREFFVKGEYHKAELNKGEEFARTKSELRERYPDSGGARRVVTFVILYPVGSYIFSVGVGKGPVG